MNERACKRCGRLTWSSRSPYCLEHRPPPELRARWATKTREARGYGIAHRTLRAQYARLVAAGEAVCARCHRPITSGEPFDLDHSPDRTSYLGVSHRRCNRLAGARKGAAVANASRPTRRPDWLPPQEPEPAGKRRWSQNWNAPNPAPPDVVILGGD